MEHCGIVKAFPKVKRTIGREEKEPPALKRKLDETAVTGNAFRDLTVYILPASIGKARCDIFQRHIYLNGGQTESLLSPTVSHIVVDDSMDSSRAYRLLQVDSLPSSVQMVKCSWLSLCITEKRLVDTANYCINKSSPRNSGKPLENAIERLPMSGPQDTKETAIPKIREEQSAEKELESKEGLEEEDRVSQDDLEALISGQHPKEQMPCPSTGQQRPIPGKWVCAQSSQSKIDNHNKHITDKLEMLAKAYTHQGDKWRALGYAKAVNALKSYHKPITSYREACQIQGIGKRMADKIDEIMESGHLRKLDHIGEAVPILELFTNVWGAGSKTAQLWYQQGYRTLEDIRTKANLNNTQKIGLKHYDDFLDRMPRQEAAAIEKTVKEAAQSLDPGLFTVACGSYRRGKATCGDVDVLISHPDGQSHKGVFSKVLQSLHGIGFLTDDLVSHEENGDQKKYMGVCRLPGPGQHHRRLDIIVVPYAEFACALMYFTGSAHFNRSMRAMAKTKNMSLSEHSLNKDVLRHGSVKVYGGTPLLTTTERDICKHLGIPYREPCERDW